MSLRRRIDTARARTERLMIDECTITRRAGDGTYNPATLGYDTVPAPTTVYDGRCLVQARSRSGDTVDAGDEAHTLHTYDVYLPVTATGTAVDDDVAVRSTGDDDLDGATLRVIDVIGQSMLAQRHLVCERNLR